MKATITILIFLISLNGMYAQNIKLDWVKPLAGPQECTGLSITTDANGFVYSTGIFRGLVDFDPGSGIFNMTGVGAGDIFISKMDSSGNFIWAKQMTGTDYCHGKSIALDAAGNIYITGNFTYAVDFDPGPGEFFLSTDGHASYFIVKLDNNGNFAWASLTGGNPSSSLGSSVTVDGHGDIITTGLFGRVSFTDIFISKLNSVGNIIWSKLIGAGNTIGFGINVTTDDDGNIYTTGYFNSGAGSPPVDFDPGPGVFYLQPTGGADVFVLKLNPAGGFIWARQFSGTEFEEGTAIKVDKYKNVFITGYFEHQTDFDPGPGTFKLTSKGTKDIFIVKLNPSGDFVWAKQVGGSGLDEGKSIKLDAIGNVYVGGFFSGTVDFDPGTGTFNLSANGETDIFMLKLDPNGNLRWAIAMGGEFSDGITTMDIDPFDNIYSTGYFVDFVDFDPGPGVFMLHASGGNDVFIHKMNLCKNYTFSSIVATACSAYQLNGETYNTSGVYTQVINNSANCDSIISLDLTINNRYSFVQAEICQGESYYAGGAYQTSSGVYTDSLPIAMGCDSVITTTLTVNPIPVPDLGSDRRICSNSSVSISPGVFNSYLWQNNYTGSTINVSAVGTYWVYVTDINNCAATDSLTILDIDTIPVNFLPTNQEICFGTSLSISVPGYASYLWSNGAMSEEITVRNFGTYFLTVTDFNQCKGTDSVTIQRANCIPVGIPNAFTPNGDGINDLFKPTIFQEYLDYHFVVFNRFGQAVFDSKEYGKGWDGTLKGKAQPNGTYVYRVSFTNNRGWLTEENGAVLLIR